MCVDLFLCGDVMLGRGIDQIMPNPGDPELHEPCVRDAREYVAMAEARNGPIPHAADFGYVWGDALAELERRQPDFRIINLETSVTASSSYWPNKEIHYRMHPANVRCLQEARIDCAVLANNHVLDFGHQGLLETLATLEAAGIQVAGAGPNMERASKPAVLDGGRGNRVLVYGCAHGSSGVSADWPAEKDSPGINLLPDFSEATLAKVKEDIAARKQPGDTVILSVHWGGNWGYEIEEGQRQFAHRLIDEAGVDVVHGHSSHHAKGIERYRRKLILYGCGDFMDDYEGIAGYEAFRSDLALMYFVRVNPAGGTLVSLQMVPMQIRHFRLQPAARKDAMWLCETLKRECQAFAATIELSPQNVLQLLDQPSV